MENQRAELDKKHAQEVVDKFANVSLGDVKPHLDTLAKKLLPSETLQSLPADFRDSNNKQR